MSIVQEDRVRAAGRATVCLVSAGAALLIGGVPAPAEEPPPEAVLAVLPFLDSPEPNRILVDLAPEGSAKPLRLMLDTGASHSVMTPLAARELGVQVRRTNRIRIADRRGSGGTCSSSSTHGSRTPARRRAGSMACSAGTSSPSTWWSSTSSARRVRLLDPKRYSLPAASSALEEAMVPLRVVAQRPGVEVSVNGEEFVVLLDTGAPWSAVLSGKLARSAAVASEKLDGLEAGTVYGPMAVELGEALRLGIGPFEFANVPLLVAPKGWYNAGFAGDSVVGYDLLSQFVLRVDYANQRMWMRRDPAAKLRFSGADVAVFRESGLLLIPKQDRFLAYIVRPDSAGARRGLLPGDWIEGMVSAEAIAKTLREGQALTAIRNADGIGVDTVLEAVDPPTAVSAPPQNP